MARIILFLFSFSLALTASAQQYPPATGKLRLGYQTTALGLVHYKSGAPTAAPSNYLHDTEMIIDSSANVLWHWQGDAWYAQGVVSSDEPPQARTASVPILDYTQAVWANSADSLMYYYEPALSCWKLIGAWLGDSAPENIAATATTGAVCYEEGTLWFDRSVDSLYAFVDTSWVAVGAGGVSEIITDATIDYSSDTLRIAQQAAQVGQVLKWNGTTWLPAADNSGGTGSQDTIYFAAQAGPGFLATNGTTVTFVGGGKAQTNATGGNIIISVPFDTTTLLVQDSILSYVYANAEVGRDTIRLAGIREEADPIALPALADSVYNLTNALTDFNVQSFRSDTAYSLTEGQVAWNEDDMTLDIGLAGSVVLQTGQESLILVKNQTGSTIADGKVVQFAGTLGASGRILASLANAGTTPESKYVIGITTQSIANGADGFVTAFGKVRGIDTDGSACGETWVDGDILFLSASSSGCLTKVKPTAPDIKLPIAVVVNAANNGTLFVRPTFFPSLSDVRDVHLPSIVDGQVLTYNGAQSRWEPATVADQSATNELQTISKVGSVVTLSDGGGSFVDAVDDDDADPTNELQSISRIGNTILLSDLGGQVSVEDDDADPTNELQAIFLSNDTLTLSDGGGSVVLPSGGGGSSTGWLKDSLSAGDVSIDANQNDFAITDLNLMRFSVDTFQFLNLNSTLLYSNSGFSSFGNHLTNIREGRLLRWQSDSPFKSRNYLAISEPFDYVTINAGFGIDSLGRAQPGVTTSAPHIAGPQGGLDGYIGYSAADSTISVYYNSQWRPLAWRSQISGGGAGTGWLKDSLEAGDVEILADGNTLSLRNSSASAGTDSLLILDADLDNETRTNHLLTFRFGGNEAGFTTYDTNFSFYNTVAGEGLSYSSDIFGAVDTSLLKDRQIPDIGTVRRLIGTGGGGVFESVAGVVRSTSANTDDFVFGSSQLNDSGNTAEDPRFFFDKSLSAFYAGTFQNAGVNTRGGYSVAFGLNPAAQGLYSTVLGGSNNVVTGAASVIVNGQNNNITSTFGFIGSGVNHDNNGDYNFIGSGVDNNATSGTSHAFIGSGADLDITNSSTYSSIASGRQNTIDESDYTLVSGGYLNDVDTSDFSFIAGGLNNNVEGSSSYSAILGGSNNNVRRNTLYSSILGGAGNETDANYSVASGEESRAELPWSKVHAASSFRIPGDAQDMKLIARGGQTGTTGLSIGLGGSSGNYLTVPENSAWAYKSQCIITVINAGTGNVEKGDSKSQFNVGHIQNIGGTMYHTGTIQNLFNDDDVDMSTSFMSYSADGTNDALRITFTPPQAPAGSATTITWAVCTIDVTQVVWDGL